METIVFHPFTRFVEVGRVVLINYGPDAGKIATVVDVVDGKREQNIKEKWEATAWAKKLAVKKARATAGDFDRFKVMIAKKQKAKIVAEKLGAR
eukprot:scaffold3867_cov150-Ochromonas_danica.AAC.8